MSALAEIEAAAETLSREEKGRLLRFLAVQLRGGSFPSEPRADPVEAVGTEANDGAGGVRGTHSVLEIPPLSVGRILRPLSADDDLLGEMLEDRA